MYKIIGADHREYGPATADEIRQWIREGRANGQTLIQPEGGTEWRPLATFPELASALPTGLAAQPQPQAPPSGDELANRDYELDIFDCIRRGWNFTTANFWPVVGVSFLVIVANGVLNKIIELLADPFLSGLDAGRFDPVVFVALPALIVATTALGSVFNGGLFYYLLKMVRGQPAELGDAFYGFTKAFVPLAVLGVVMGLLMCLGLVFCILPGIYLAIAWTFSVPLLVDRKLQFWDAMELSRKVVTRHWFVVFGFLLVNGLFAFAGVLACCVGIFVTVPMAMVSMVYAYEDIFGARANKSI